MDQRSRNASRGRKPKKENQKGIGRGWEDSGGNKRVKRGKKKILITFYSSKKLAL